MTTVKYYVEFVRMMAELQLNLVGVNTRDDRGAVSTEMAVVIAAMVAIAAVAAIIFMQAARDNANQIQVPAPPG